MLKIHDDTIGFKCKDLDKQCFPDLFPTGTNVQYDDRPIKLHDYDYVRSHLMSKHPQFRLNMQYLFHLLNDDNRRKLTAGIFTKLNVVNSKHQYSVGDYLKKLEENVLEQNLNTIFSRLRGTEAYMAKPRNELNCIVRERGPATFFITLSPGEWMWSALADYMREVNGWIEGNRTVSELIVADPVSASIYIYNKFNAVLAYLQSSDEPIGKIKHFYYVTEYQGRGLPHFHCLFWIENAPIYGVASNEEVQAFIQQYLTC